MEWYIIVIAVIFGVPLILAPVALVWYLNVSGLYRVLVDVRQRQKRRAIATKEAEKLAEELAAGKWTHDYPISVEEARGLGLPVNTEVPTEVYQLMNLFPQSGLGRPTVGYIPVPYPTHRPTPRNSNTHG